ncbi:hypothetical protein ACFV3R_01365 [Streptomyces sp. NPDC059740]|uniref:hypothetical protein n=1 Tax=Streptomyces sp. NPDC059740 TaxID=3346926 RepID=UPI003667B2E0
MTALASAVALAVALPLAAATARPARSERTPPQDPPQGSALLPATGAVGSGLFLTGERTDPGAGRGPTSGPHRGLLTGKGDGAGTPLTDGGGPQASEDHATVCGPELAAPQGLQAQTCVTAADGRVGAVSYYRNSSGAPLRAVVTLMGRDGAVRQAHCEVPAADEPGECRTSTRPLGTDTPASAVAAHEAVTEFSDPKGERLLLRVGSARTAAAGSDSVRS